MRTLPIETGTAVQVVAIHVLEHVNRWEAEAILREWGRVLQPGGQLVIEVPCMDKVFEYIRGLKTGDLIKAQRTTWAFWGDPQHQDESMMHKWGYFVKELTKLMTKAGFTSVQEEYPRYHMRVRDMRVTGRKP